MIGSPIPHRTIVDRLRLLFKNEKQPGGDGIKIPQRSKSAPIPFRDYEGACTTTEKSMWLNLAFVSNPKPKTFT